MIRRSLRQCQRIAIPLTRGQQLVNSSFRYLCTSNSTRQEHIESSPSLRSSSGKPCLRTCVVTGGTSGIGYEISKKLVLNGASRVIITSRSAEKARQAIDRIRQEPGQEQASLEFVEYDFKSLDAIADIWKSVSSVSASPVDTLINCAGLSQSQGLLMTTPEQTSEILRVNLQVPIELSRRLLKDYMALGKKTLKKVNDGDTSSKSFCVINVSSLLAERGGYGTSVYSSSKAGLTAFTRTLSLEAAAIRDRYPALPPFRANVVLPGYVDTPMIEGFSDSHKHELTSQIPLRRYGTSEEVADAVMFLLNNEYANNTVLNLDGGLSAV